MEGILILAAIGLLIVACVLWPRGPKKTISSDAMREIERQQGHR